MHVPSFHAAGRLKGWRSLHALERSPVFAMPPHRPSVLQPLVSPEVQFSQGLPPSRV
jgi:hypothetical protein